jgi:hypothetical protein
MTVMPLRPMLALAVCSALSAQAPRLQQAAEDVLPASTYAVARFGGLSACSEAAAAMPLAGLARTFLQRVPERVREVQVERMLDHAAQHVREVLQRAGLRAADVQALLRQPMALAVGRLSLEGLGPSVALVIEEGEHGDSIARCVQALEHAASQAGITVGATKVGDLAVRQALHHDGPPVFAASVGGFFVVTNSRGYLRDLAEVVRGTRPGLAATSRLPELRRRLGAPALASMFVNTAVFGSMFAPHLPYEAADLGAALGLGGVDALYAGSAASAHGGTDVLHMGVGGSERGLMKALVAKPADLGFAHMCSHNTVVFGAGSFDAPAVVAAFERVIALLPEHAREEVHGDLERGLGRGLQHLGLSPEAADRLLHAFGDQVAFAIGLEKGAVPKPELLLHVGVRDAKAIAPLLAQLEQATARHGHEWKARQVGDREIRFCNVAAPHVQLQLSPCYVLTDTSLVFGSDVAALVRALRQGERADESFAAQADFAEMAAAGAGASGVLHLRLFRAAELGWRSVETMLYPQIDAHEQRVGFGSEALPDAEAMARAVGTSTFLYTVDEDGVTWRSRGTLTFGSLLAGFGGLADEVLSRAGVTVY